jgi:hypothetical protein
MGGPLLSGSTSGWHSESLVAVSLAKDPLQFWTADEAAANEGTGITRNPKDNVVDSSDENALQEGEGPPRSNGDSGTEDQKAGLKTPGGKLRKVSSLKGRLRCCRPDCR